MTYAVVGRLADGLVLVFSVEHGRQMWSRAPLRKRIACAGCECDLQPRDFAYRPAGNSMNRYVRLCVTCIEG